MSLQEMFVFNHGVYIAFDDSTQIVITQNMLIRLGQINLAH